MSLKFIRQQFPNIEHDEQAEEITDAEQLGNLMHRTLGLAKCLNSGMPDFVTGVQLGLIYKRLEEIEEAFGIAPEYPMEDETITNNEE